MRVKCSWCNNILEFDDDNKDDVVSHGICMACSIKVLEEAGVDPLIFIRAYLRGKQPDRIYPSEDKE